MRGNPTNPPRASDVWRQTISRDTQSVARPTSASPTTSQKDQTSHLQLVGTADASHQPIIEPIVRATDPRWVLALRVVEMMEGPILEPQRRERLIKLGQSMGLTAFDSNMVIAIMQDQARRGVSPDVCPRSGLAQLSMISPSHTTKRNSEFRRGRAWLFALTLAGLVAIELMLIFGWVG